MKTLVDNNFIAKIVREIFWGLKKYLHVFGIVYESVLLR